MIRLAPLPSRERVEFGWFVAGGSVVVAALVWLLWVLPINHSIESATPTEIGAPIAHEAKDGAAIGIWSTGASALLGSMQCTVTGPLGDQATVRTVPVLGWDDTLWWVTARSGFKQTHWFTASGTGTHTVDCIDSLGSYGGEYLLADSTNAGGLLGMGRSGGVTFPLSSALAVAAVGAPLLAVLLTPIMAIQTVRLRRRRNSHT